MESCSQDFLGFKSVSTWSIEIYIFESHNGFCMSLTDAIVLNDLWGRPGLTRVEHWSSFWVTERHSSLFLHDRKNCVFPEKCSWKGKIKPASYLEVMKLTKLGWFCFLVCYGRVFLVFYILFNASQCLPWQNRPSVHFCTGMSENGCVYCQKNVSFHFETLK